MTLFAQTLPTNSLRSFANGRALPRRMHLSKTNRIFWLIDHVRRLIDEKMIVLRAAAQLRADIAIHQRRVAELERQVDIYARYIAATSIYKP